MESGPPCWRSDPTPTGERGTDSLVSLFSLFRCEFESDVLPFAVCAHESSSAEEESFDEITAKTTAV